MNPAQVPLLSDIPKNSELILESRSFFRIHQMLESGRMHQIQSKWLDQDLICEVNVEDNLDLGMDLVYTVFIMLLCAVFISFILLLAEILMVRVHKNSKFFTSRHLGQNYLEPQDILGSRARFDHSKD